MKIAVAQTRPFKGDIEKNIQAHLRLIEQAVAHSADAIFFPELSLTGYEPALAKRLAMRVEEKRLNIFEEISVAQDITIGVGLPINSPSGILIGLLIFQPGKARKLYSKKFLHVDELPWFVNGPEQVHLNIKGKKINPAICYESLLYEHAEAAFKNGVGIYVASVAKSAVGVQKAFRHYPKIAAQFATPVLMANCVGFCDNFESAGNTAAWNSKGELIGQLDAASEGILVFDTQTECCEPQ